MNKPIRSRSMALRGWLVSMLLLLLLTNANAKDADLTMEVAGDLLMYGGVVTVYPIPVPAEDWASGISKDATAIIRLDRRYSEVQLRYPANGTYTYRFSPAGAARSAERHATQILSVIGADEQGRGPDMKAGFKDSYTSGGRIIRVLSAAETNPESEATQTNAKWGMTEGIHTPPPADERSARSLSAIFNRVSQPFPLECSGSINVQVCTVPSAEWPKLEALWWRSIAESRLERLHFYALNRCYDSGWLRGGNCDPVPGSNEPEFQKRR